MLRIMNEEGRKAVVKQQGSGPRYFLAENLPVSGTDFVPFLPQLTIHELGKQLLKASNDGNLEEIRTLMSKGAPFSADWLGTSPLHLAAHNDHLEVVQILLQAGMSRDARTKVDRTPLHMASYEGHLRIVECLLMNGADYDCKDLLHMTPLHWAAQNGHAEVAAMLIRYGASTTIINKFNLTALDIALQVNRPDIVHIINLSIRDPSVATQTIALELVNENSLESTIEPIIALEENEDNVTGTESPQSIPLETIILEDEESLDTTENTTQFEEQPEVIPESIEAIESDGNAFSESIKLLQQHGITMLPVEDNNILSTVMESGHSVVLTEAGKQALNSIKSSEINQDISEYLKPKPVPIPSPQVKKKKIITVTPEEFLAMANNGTLSSVPQANILKQINGKIINQSPKTVQMKRIVMKKNKLVPISPNVNVTNLQKIENVQDVDCLLEQLHKAYNLIETYKCKLMKCEMEVERYKYQLKMIKKQRKLSSPT